MSLNLMDVYSTLKYKGLIYEAPLILVELKKNVDLYMINN